MKINFEKVITDEQIKILADIANIIWHEAYKEIVPAAQIDYMIKNFQSFNPLSQAINKNGYEYYLIKSGENVAGYIGLHEENEKLFLSKLYIARQYRGKQVASKTFEYQLFCEFTSIKFVLSSTFCLINPFKYMFPPNPVVVNACVPIS